MRAVVYERYGSEDVLRLVEVPVPEPGRGQVLVRVAATSMNPADRALRAGDLRRVLRLRLPFTPGSDVAGVVEAVGTGVSDIAVGLPVWALQPPKAGGACAEFVVVQSEHVSPAPARVTLKEAAALPLVGLTALQALRDRAHLRAGQRLLVFGAAGGVGTAAVQIGRALGAEVTAVAGRRHADLLARLGASTVLAREDLDQTRRQGPGRAAAGAHDVVLDAVARLDGHALRSALVPGGAAVSTDPSRAFRSLLGSVWSGRRHVRSVLVRPSGADLAVLAGWVDAGVLTPVVERERPLQEVAQAHRDSARQDAQGKTVLVVDAALAARGDLSPLALGRAHRLCGTVCGFGTHELSEEQQAIDQSHCCLCLGSTL